MSDDWFEEEEPDRWTPRLPPDAAAELEDAVGRLVARLADPTTPPLRIEEADGTEYGHTEIAEVAEVSAEVLVAAIRGGPMGTAELSVVASAATNLRLIAMTLFEALASVDPEGKDDSMGVAAVLSRILHRAMGALDRTVVRTPEGRFRLRWSAADRELVASMARELDAGLEGDDPSMVRLFPPAYGTDETRSREYAALAHHELIESRRAALATVESALARDEIEADELHAVMRAVNDLRLVIGTELDVTEDDPRRPVRNGPDAERWAAYERLTRILGQIVGALDA